MTLLLRYRLSLSIFIVGLIFAGFTAFPLLHELSIISSWIGISDPAGYKSLSGLQHWIGFVFFGLQQTYANYPFLAYGTDWLAFGHLVIALFFIGPFIDPLKNEWVLYCGIAACIAVIPLALICGPIRQIPQFWTFIDCSFGLFGLLPLLYCLSLTRRMRKASGTTGIYS